MNLTLQAFKANSPSGIDAAFVRMASDQAQALMILADSSPPWSTADRTHAGPSLSITTGFGRPIWPTAPFAIAFSIGFVLGAVTVVSTYDRECPSHEHELSETEQPDDLRGLRVLLVEDSPAVADALKQHLELLGATVAGPAATTDEAKELMRCSLPHVALIDFHLRGENSYSLIAQLREVGIPVIMLSGSIEFAMPIALKGVVMLEKPVKEEQILEHLRPIARPRQK